MSIFHHLVERVWDGYLTLKQHVEKYPKSSDLKSKDYMPDYGQTQSKLRQLGKELSEKKKLINSEVKTIDKNVEDLAVLKENMSELFKLMERFGENFACAADGTKLAQYGQGYLDYMTKNIHRLNDLLNTAHNLLGAINKEHRLLQKEEKRLEK